MSFIEESLSSGEEIVAIFRLHWVSRIPLALFIVLGPVTLGVMWLVAIYEYLRLRAIEQGVTNKRVIFKTGIIGRKSEEMKLTSIETVEIEQGVLGRMFNFGNVKITGRGTSDLAFKGINDPMSVKRQIESVSNPVA
ncbi:MAG: PH domain-containing protein [Betaproteobacteria bacterium]|nr:PH domain-containing protein [Betaproteobacteria bacterium]